MKATAINPGDTIFIFRRPSDVPYTKYIAHTPVIFSPQHFRVTKEVIIYVRIITTMDDEVGSGRDPPRSDTNKTPENAYNTTKKYTIVKKIIQQNIR